MSYAIIEIGPTRTGSGYVAKVFAPQGQKPLHRTHTKPTPEKAQEAGKRWAQNQWR